jgi:hypothetical protein
MLPLAIALVAFTARRLMLGGTFLVRGRRPTDIDRFREATPGVAADILFAVSSIDKLALGHDSLLMIQVGTPGSSKRFAGQHVVPSF